MTPLDADAAREAWNAPCLKALVAKLHGLHPSTPLPTIERAARRALVVDPDETELARLRAEVRTLRAELARERERRELAELRRERLGEMYCQDLYYALKTGTVGP